MKVLRFGSALVLAAIAGLTLSTVQGEAKTPFDGNWMVHAAANPGTCSDKYGVAIKVANGHVAYQGILAAFASGNVTSSGNILLQVGEAKVTGKLASATGGGSWASPNCKGTWTASRL